MFGWLFGSSEPEFIKNLPSASNFYIGMTISNSPDPSNVTYQKFYNKEELNKWWKEHGDKATFVEMLTAEEAQAKGL